MPTLREKYIAGLEVLGFHRDYNTRSRKYIKMVNGDRTYWVGTHGGLRFGRISSDTFGVSSLNKKKLAAVGAEHLKKVVR
jgi:hypothetical protein